MEKDESAVYWYSPVCSACELDSIKIISVIYFACIFEIWKKKKNHQTRSEQNSNTKTCSKHDKFSKYKISADYPPEVRLYLRLI